MKHLLSTCLLLVLLSSFALAQKNEGIIYFEEKINIHRNLPPEAADMKAMIPEFRTHSNELLFNETESLYRNADEEEDEEGSGGQPVVIRMQRPEAVFYKNFSTMHKVDSREFIGKTYLIADSLTGRNWKITGESKKILGYDCMSAVTSDTAQKKEITAWFADALPLATGPSNFSNLPGTILEIDVNNGEMVISAKKIEFKKLKKNDIVAPKSGEKTTDAEFKKMMEAKMKEMGGRPMRMIRN
jgi:GLPGLI family protein